MSPPPAATGSAAIIHPFHPIIPPRRLCLGMGGRLRGMPAPAKFSEICAPLSPLCHKRPCPDLYPEPDPVTRDRMHVTGSGRATSEPALAR